MLPRLAEKFQVYLGFNLRESVFVARAVGLEVPKHTPGGSYLFTTPPELLKIDTLVIHCLGMRWVTI